jgi:hypothetical protein
MATGKQIAEQLRKVADTIENEPRAAMVVIVDTPEHTHGQAAYIDTRDAATLIMSMLQMQRRFLDNDNNAQPLARESAELEA